MQTPCPSILPLYEKALAHDQQGDIYTAVKIFKKIIKIAPEWATPYQYLSRIYKYNCDWKAAFHYGQQAIENGADQEDTWRNFGIAATALKKWQLARTAWQQVGFQLRMESKAPDFDMGLIPVRLSYQGLEEIVWARQIDPARAVLESIPYPVSDRSYGDTILIDYRVTGYRMLNGKQLAVYDELELLKRSFYRPWLVVLPNANKKDVQLLDQLCFNEDLGFDNWSQLSLSQLNANLSRLPEYYNEDLPTELSDSATRIAIAAISLDQVAKVMKVWTTISLKSFQIAGVEVH